MKLLKSKLFWIIFFVLATLCCMGVLLGNWYIQEVLYEELASSIKDATRIDVYLFGNRRISYRATLPQNKWPVNHYGTKDRAVLGPEVETTLLPDLSSPFKYDSGMLFRFYFPGKKLTLDVQFTRVIHPDPSLETVPAACFLDPVSENLFLLKIRVGVGSSEPDLSAKKYRDRKGKYLEIADPHYFEDLKARLREEYFLD